MFYSFSILLPGLVILGVLCSVTGLVMIWVGATGVRRTDHCLCGYDLRGVPRRIPRCPECGRRGPFVTVKRPRLLGWGIALLVIPPGVALVGIVLGILFLAAG